MSEVSDVSEDICPVCPTLDVRVCPNVRRCPVVSDECPQVSDKRGNTIFLTLSLSYICS